MMRVIFLLLVSSIAFQSNSQTWNNFLQKRFKSYGIWADSILLVPNDTSVNKTGFAIKGTTAYIGNGTKWTAISAENIPVTNGLVQVDSIRATDTLEVTIYATNLTPAIWRINGVQYSFNRDSSFAITAATTGFFRKDIIVGNTSGRYQLIQGVEATTTAVQPATPANTVLITVVDVTGASVVPPAPDLSGFAKLNDDNNFTGLNTFYGETDFRWIVNFYSSAFRFKNQANSNTSTITWPTNASYVWAYPNVTGQLASRRDTLSMLTSRYRFDSLLNAGTTNIGNTNLRLTGDRTLSGGAGASNGYSFTYDSLASFNITKKSDGTDYLYVGQDGNLILNNDAGEVLNIGSDGAFNLSNKNEAFDANISRIELSAGADTATFTFKSRTKIKAEKVNPNNGSAYKILVRNEGSKEVEYVDAVNVDTTVLATKAYVNYKDDIQDAAINGRATFGDVRDIVEDTANVLRAKILADSTTLASSINSKVNISDTATMLSGYKNATILTSGTLADARLSSNVNLLNTSQTITGNKVTTGLFTARANNIDSILDLSKGFVLENLTPSTVTQQKRYSPAFVWKGQAFNAGAGGSGIANGNNEFQWKAELRASVDNAAGGGASRTANNLVFSQKSGTNDWVDAVTFTRNGISAALDINTITLGRSGANGSLTLVRGSDGTSMGSISAGSANLNITTGALYLGVGNSGTVAFSGNPSFGTRYFGSSGWYFTIGANNNATPSSRIVVDGNASIGANVAAPTNGLQVAGESIFTSTRTAVTSTGVDLTLSASHSVVALTTTGLTITLPTAVGITGRTYTIINESSGSNTIATTSSQLIGNFTTASTYTLPSDGSVTVVSNGTKWLIKSKF